MSRYIDADLIPFSRDYGRFVTMEDDVDSVPNANVVEVIRCEQCKFWDRKHISCEGYAKCNTGESGIRLRRKNDYCSVAKPLTDDDMRKEDEKNV